MGIDINTIHIGCFVAEANKVRSFVIQNKTKAIE